MNSKMIETNNVGTQWWNDSCNITELEEAVLKGASGATSNPVIVFNAVKNDEARWKSVLQKIIVDYPHSTEDEIAWKLVETVCTQASKVLLPVFEKTSGMKGRLSVQVHPKYYKNSELMTEHGLKLSKLAPNIAIKAPSTLEGIKTFEELTAQGVCVNATVSFSLSQVIASAEAIERGLERAKASGIDVSKVTPYITIMVGRIDDQLRKEMDEKNIALDPSVTHWGGVSVFKKAYKIFKERGYKARLLSAAYRNPMQWSELNGQDVLMTIPYKWWNRFDKSDFKVESKINEPVDESIVNTLRENFADFRKVYDETGINVSDIESYGACKYTINQFLGGYDQLIQYVRKHMIYN